LKHGEWSKLVGKLPFGLRTAQMLMEIADNAILTKAKHVSHLPASWGTLHLLTTIEDEPLEKMLTDGTINADTERKEVEKIIKKMKNEGVFRFDDLRRCLHTLVNWMGRYPDASKVADDAITIDDDVEEEDEYVGLEELTALMRWVADLHLEAAQNDFEENGADYIRNAEAQRRWREEEAKEKLNNNPPETETAQDDASDEDDEAAQDDASDEDEEELKEEEDTADTDATAAEEDTEEETEQADAHVEAWLERHQQTPAAEEADTEEQPTDAETATA
jgi:hypothetical protein